ncbi:MAG: hypothetical protein ABI591_19425 [Kofleriaceae bacterium]
MNRTWAVLLVAACGTPSKPAPRVVVPPPIAAPVPPPSAAMSGHPDPRMKIEAPHGGPIALVAETPDGTAAITSDELGGMRLWPTLDGTREPCVVDLATPRDIAIHRHHDGFFLALVDAAQNLTLVVIDDQGRTLRHVAITNDAGISGIEMTDLGVLAWSSDQTITLYDFEGAPIGRIGTEPGQRLVNLAARGNMVVTVVDVRAGSASKRIVRQLEITPKLAWDKPIDIGGDVLGTVAISRSGKRIAAASTFLDSKTKEIRVIEQATGRTLATQPIDTALEFGFTDEDHLAVGIGNGVTWIDVRSKTVTVPVGSSATAKTLFATGDGQALTAMGGEMMVAKPDDPKYLGYELESPQVATSGPNGNLVVGLGAVFAQLDSSLTLVAGAATPAVPPNTTVAELAWIGGDDYAASMTSADGTNQTMVIASDGRAPVAIRPSTTVSRAIRPLRYEPSTHLVTVSFGDAPTIDRWIPEQRRVEKVATIPRGKGFQQRQLVPVAPALAGGAAIIEVSLDEKTTVAWTDATTKTQIARMPITSFVTADPAGHVYAWTVDAKTTQLVLSVLAPGKNLATLPHDGTVTLWPDPKGTRVLELGATGAALYRIDGTLVWKLPLIGSSEAVWSGDRAISLVTASGVARIDAATGTVVAARCGWKFGLTATPHPQPPRVEPICTQLRH